MDALEANQLFRYEENTGYLYWKTSKIASFVGKRAGTSLTAGYRQVSVKGKFYREHRVIWLIATGSWPKEQIDHINGIRDDNRLSNLREVSHIENHRNVKLQDNNTSGVAGVTWSACAGKWHAQIKIHNKVFHLGYYDDIGLAAAARKEAEKESGFHSNHGSARPTYIR